MLYCMRRSDGLGRTWTWSTAWLASTVDYTVLVQNAPHSHVPVGTDAFWILEQRQSSRWAGQRWVLGATRWGVLPCRILFRYPRRLRIGSRRQGTEGGVGS